MRLKCLWIGGTKDPSYLRLELEYAQRIQRFVPLEVVTVPETRKVDPRKHASQFSKEVQSLEKRIGLKSCLVALDERGEEFTSEGFSDFVANQMNRGGSEVIFLGGGHLGIPGVLLEKSDLRLSLSRFTLPHEMARVLLLEQIYRSFSIIRGLPYHR